MDLLTEDVRKDVPGSIMFADNIVLCGDDDTDMTEYLETWRRTLEDRDMRISTPKTQFIDFKFGQDNGQGREPVKILGEELHYVSGVTLLCAHAKCNLPQTGYTYKLDDITALPFDVDNTRVSLFYDGVDRRKKSILDLAMHIDLLIWAY